MANGKQSKSKDIMVIYITPISNRYLWGKNETKENWWVAAVINSQIHFIRSIWTWVEFLGEVDIF